jgi:predicted esterase
MTNLGFVHRFVAATDPNSSIVLLLLHGTGGNEQDLIPLGQQLAPGAALLSPRGNVLENGMPRFFRRFAEGVFDVEDLKRRADELADFIDHARDEYSFAGRRLVAVGYSNGANIAAGMMLRHPEKLSAACLFRAMVPYKPDKLPVLADVKVFLSAGQRDPIVPVDNTNELATILRSAGADVVVHWHAGGHELGQDDLDAARAWFIKGPVSSI